MFSVTGRVVRKNQQSSIKSIPRRNSPVDQFEEALQRRDFSKATTILEFFKNSGQKLGNLDINAWLAYCAFHMNDIEKAIDVYKEILTREGFDPMNYIYLGCCNFAMGSYEEAEENALRGTECPLRNRLLFHIAQKTHDEAKLMSYHHQLKSTVEDQLSLAAAQYNRNHYPQAIEICKRILQQSPEYIALNVYLAMCYYKNDYYDVSLEILQNYLKSYPNSAIAINLKACNHYRLYNGKSAESELKTLIDLYHSMYNVESDIIKHNLVVFRDGESALQVLPPLLEAGIPEARLNLVIYYLRQDQINEAYELIKDMSPMTSQEYIIRAVVNAYMGQQLELQDNIKVAKECFHFVGSAQSECDTIPGRQCMASYFFLIRDFNNVLIYLRSIKPYFQKDDTFLYLYGISCADVGNFEEAEESLIAVKSEKIKSEFCYRSWLVRSHIMNKHAKKAWDIYLKMETCEALGILRLMANDCYKTSAFYYAAKAFDVLERLENDMEFIEGKKGACIGVFQQVFANEESSDAFFDVIKMLEASCQQHADDPSIAQQFNSIAVMMKEWAKESKLKRR
ncbi:unnamed protein product [Phytomonas sp. Hart1]|nr:unnamed protein product [Phytomonas sp. Hart1]|eukprot:CCW67262.1 unnamed protein product [Phytomonas sp. isolate Hart1]